MHVRVEMWIVEGLRGQRTNVTLLVFATIFLGRMFIDLKMFVLFAQFAWFQQHLVF
jgi:hypothetical protein